MLTDVVLILILVILFTNGQQPGRNWVVAGVLMYLFTDFLFTIVTILLSRWLPASDFGDVALTLRYAIDAGHALALVLIILGPGLGTRWRSNMEQTRQLILGEPLSGPEPRREASDQDLSNPYRP